MEPSSQVREVFLQALDLSASARAAFLDGLDSRTRLRVEELLREHESMAGFMEGPASNATIEATSEKIGDVIGRYKLLEQIGEGGAGVVYMAEQLHPIRRKVALKVIKLGMDTKAVIARFEAERQALALMDHPGIAKVFDAGATESGRPFFVMELVRGVRVTDFCNERGLSTEERLKLFTQVCAAIQHAHQKGIIHRDIKPSNILVTEGDDGPAPKVIDFGIAKATEHRLTDYTLVTEFRSFIGTPAYMSPEQVEMTGRDVDTRSDVYSLGVLLYEMLTGQLPFGASLAREGLDEFRRVVREEEPRAPSTALTTLPAGELATTASQRRTDARAFLKTLRGELDWIAMKCLEKDRGRRYASANDLAVDVQRYLNGEPIAARPPAMAYRARKFVSKHRLAVAAATAVVVALVGAAIVSLREAARAREAEHFSNLARSNAEAQKARAEENESRALLNEYVADVTLAQQALAGGNFGRAHSLLAKHDGQRGAAHRGFEWGYLRRLAEGSPHRTLLEAGEQVRAVAFSRNGEMIAVGGRERVRIFDAADSSLVAAWNAGAASLSFSEDGSKLYFADESTVRIFDLAEQRVTATAKDVGAPVSLSSDGRWVAAGSREGVRLLDAEKLEPRQLLRGASGPLVFAPQGSTLVTGRRFGALAVWDVSAEPRELRRLDGRYSVGPFHQMATILAFTRDGGQMFVPRERNLVALNLANRSEIEFVAEADVAHGAPISAVAVSKDGKLATGSWDHSIKIWDASKRELVTTLWGHLNEVWTLDFSPDGRTLVSGAKDGGVFLWPMASASETQSIAGDLQPLGFSADEKTMGVLDRRTGAIRVLDVETGTVAEDLQEGSQAQGRGPFWFGRQAITPDLRWMARVREDKIELRDRHSGAMKILETGAETAHIAALAADGSSLITGGFGNPAKFWNIAAGTSAPMDIRPERALFTPDAKRAVFLTRDAKAFVWNVASASVERTINLDLPPGFGCALSPDNRTLAVGGAPDRSNSLFLYDIQTGRRLGELSGHKQAVFGAAFSPDGKTLATSSGDGAMVLWNVASMQELFALKMQAGELVFSPGGRFLACARRARGAEGIRILRADAAARVSGHRN